MAMFTSSSGVDRQDRFALVHHRKSAPRRKTGCITCKRRRVRCDEAKPDCRRCRTLGVTCDGYAVATLPASTPPLHAPAIATPSKGLDDLTCTNIEKRLSTHFRSKTAPWISGFLTDPTWECAVPKLSRSFPAVHHAACALAALHEANIALNKCERTTEGAVSSAALIARSQYVHASSELSGASPLATIAEEQYIKALSELKQLLSRTKPDLGAVVLSAMLCIYFESLRENFVPALMHGESATRLITNAKSSGTDNLIDEHIVRAMVQMDVQASIGHEARVPVLLSDAVATSTSCLPNSFESLTHARNVTYAWTSRLIYFSRTAAADCKYHGDAQTPLAVVTAAQSLEHGSREMERLLFQLANRTDLRLTVHEHLALSNLRVRVLLNIIESATCLASDATAFDAFINFFDEIVTLCAYVIHSEDMDDRPWSVVVDDGLLYPLYFTATRCRQGRMRRQALTLLRGLPGAQRMWHLKSWISSAELWIKYEEEGVLTPSEMISASEIPERRRVHMAHFNGLEFVAPQVLPKLHLRTWPNGFSEEYVDVEYGME